MAASYSKLLYHFIWSTKNREPIISQHIEERVWAYLAGIAKANSMHAYRIGGVESHIHALIELPRTMTVAEAMKLIKGGSSGWMNEDRITRGHFGWQDGYGACTVSPSKQADVEQYIVKQREHHTRRTFADEYEALLKAHDVEFDRRYHLD